MKLIKYFLQKRSVTLLLLLLIFFGGLFAYAKMGKLEDAPFTIKQALVLTPYSGASPSEVQSQVTDVLEEAIQSLGELYYLKTENRAGLSKITVYVKKEIRADEMQQLWDKLRRKVGDVQSKLPAGAGPSVVNDDFGDVLGVFYGLTGEGHTYRELEEEKKKGSMDEAEKNKRMDFLQYQIKEIKDAKLVDGEDVQLERQYKKAVNAKEILQYANDIYALTGYGATSAGEQLGRAIKDMRRLTELDEELADAAGILEDADGLLSDFNREISEYMKDMEFDEGQFREMESRLDQINSLKAKYGNSISRILESLAAFEKEYDALSGYEEHMQEIEAQWKKQTAKLEESCRVLSEHRRALSEKLCKKIRESLEDMNFNMVRFEMRFETSPNYSANGYDDACFYISTNVGEAMRPLHEVASGGELSRIMLAMKSCLANQDDTPTLVFDEIDVGISGRTAQKVAEKMSILSRQHQVICITHLSQIAAMADAHYLIEKNVENEKTISSIRLLSKEEEIEELARLIGGAKITETTIHTVTEMKGLAEQAKIN